MAWKECDVVSLREEAVLLARGPEANVSEVARRFGVSRKTLYKWLGRYDAADRSSLSDRSRRPKRCPRQSDAAVEAQVLAVRDRHPAWAGRKIARVLHNEGHRPPAPSTIGRILQRNGRVSPEASEAATPWLRFEHAQPNDLWQMDFKGPVSTAGGHCHPLTILDDHSRYALGLFACADQKRQTVQQHLISVFDRYGLPRVILCDNGPPWGCSHHTLAYTKLELWLLRYDVLMWHGRAYHPQTQGKDERFHRTLGVEVLAGRSFAAVADVQPPLDAWRPVYNHIRPHEALALAVPASRYRMSVRAMPRQLPALEYDGGDELRKVNAVGRLRYRGRSWSLGEAFAGEVVGLRQTPQAGVMSVYFGRHCVARLDPERRVIEVVRDRPDSPAPAAGGGGGGGGGRGGVRGD
jgi:transposase InsO family protein